jgi:hypothetical protein
MGYEEETERKIKLGKYEGDEFYLSGMDHDNYSGN